MSSAILVLCSFMMCMFLMCAVMLIVLVKRSKKTSLGGAGAAGTAGAALPNTPSGNAPLNIAPKVSYKSGELVSSTVANVQGLKKTGGPTTMYTGEHAAITPPAGAPSNAAASQAWPGRRGGAG